LEFFSSEENSRNMKNLYLAGLFILLAVAGTQAQICDSITPVFNVNLAGQPNGTWTSPPIQRDGYCCGVSGSDKCLEFDLTLDTAAVNIVFNVASGAMPGGALFYQVNCGPPMSVGQPICLSGAGPHIITFCKPGNNTNTYSITSSSVPSLSGVQLISQACSGLLVATGLSDTSINWTSVPFNATYNSYLNCTSGCDSVTVTPSGAFPPFVDYQVCGYPAGGCGATYFCDTIRIYFVNNLAVSITPQNPVICFADTFASVTATPAGGFAPYHYLWSNGLTTQNALLLPGTYTVQLTDSMNCFTATDTVTVTKLAFPITASAGPDQLTCIPASASLNGSVIAATGGWWTGGSGTYAPDDSSLNTVYTPSAAEIAAGQAHLYLVTTGNSGCPADTDDVFIQVSSDPVPVISGTDTVCQNSLYIYSAPSIPGVTWSWSATGGIMNVVTPTLVTVQWGLAGNGTVTLTGTNASGCDSTVTMPVVIYPTPMPVILGTVNVCSGSTSGYSVTPVPGYTYKWTVTGGTITGSDSAANVNIQWSAAGAATVTILETTAFGCDSSGTFGVTVLQMPAPSISGPDTVCAGETVTYTTPFQIGNTYSWSVTNGAILTATNNQCTVMWPVAGAGTITLTEANTLSCDTTVTLNVFTGIQPAPVLAGPAAVCTGSQTAYTVTNPVAGDSYSWQVSGGTITGVTTGSTINVQWFVPGTGNVTVTVANSTGCDSTKSLSVNIHLMPAPLITGPIAVCAGQIATYTTPAVTGNTYAWSVTTGTILAIINNSITVQWNTPGNGSVSVTENNTPVCDSTVAVAVSIGAQPVPVIAGPITACTNTSSQFTVANPVGGEQYTWSVIGGMISGPANGTTINVDWATALNASVTLTASNSSGCDSTVSIPVIVYPSPAPVLNGPAQACEQETVTYTVVPVAGHLYFWSVTNGSILNLNPSTSIDVLWSVPGTGTVTVNEISPEGCDSIVSLSVQVDAKPVVMITGPAVICEHEPASYAALTEPGSSYAWSASGGSLNTASGQTVQVEWNAPGSGTVTLIQTNSFGCINNYQLPVVINTKPHPVINGSGVGCISAAQYQYTCPAEPAVTYQWAITGGSIVSGNGTNTITTRWLTPGNNTITVTAINVVTGCDSTVTQMVLVDSMAVPVISANGLQGCAPVQLSCSANVPDPDYLYTWKFGDGMASYTYSTSHQYLVPGTYTLSLIVTNNTGCADTATAQVSVYDVPQADFILTHTGGDIYYIGLSTLNLENITTGAVSYLWDFGNGDTSTMFEPGYEYTVPGKYCVRLTAENTYGCISSATRCLEVKLPETIYIPNSFTPNGDSRNDVFEIKLQNITDLKVVIYDRWGQQIYYSNDPNFQWDGSYHGRRAQNDVYVYVIEAVGIHGKQLRFKGAVTMLR